MKILLDKLILDRENPRFIIPRNQDSTEEEIFDYLLENEVLDELITGISRAGFFQIGEKPIVVKMIEDSDKYVVLEGNRRICALKALHGLYTKQYNFSEEFKTASAEIDVDIVNSREEIQPYLAARHIQGIQKWKPEARRNFYYRHYLNNKSLSYIENITQQKLSEIKKFIKESVFLDFFKESSGFANIDKPSLIYERIQRYLIELKLVNDFEVTEQYADCRIVINTNMLIQEEFKEFCKLLAEGIFGDDKFIDSRSINKSNDFKTLLQGFTVEEKCPRLKELFVSILVKLNRENFIPTQNIVSAVKQRVPDINQIINYSVIADSATVQILSQEQEITEENFKNGNPGSYIIKVNEHIFTFEILDFISPQIRVIEEPFKNLRINTTEDISGLITILDVYGERIEINDANISIVSNNNQLTVTPNKNILILQAGVYSFDVKYSYQNNVDYTISKNIVVQGKAFQGTPLTNYVGYFDFKYIDVMSIISSVITGQLISELENCYTKNYKCVFASALRSALELSLESFIEEAKKINPLSRWAVDNTASLKEEFKKLTDTELNSIAKKYFTKLGKPTDHGEHNPLKNYLGTNIATSPTGHLLDPVIKGLHLGAHGSLKSLYVVNLEQIKPSLIAWIELMYIIIELNFAI